MTATITTTSKITVVFEEPVVLGLVSALALGMADGGTTAAFDAAADGDGLGATAAALVRSV